MTMGSGYRSEKIDVTHLQLAYPVAYTYVIYRPLLSDFTGYLL